jgi:hypothetical protein
MRRVWARLLPLLLAACAADLGHAPVARIAASPRAIPEQDSFQTEVRLDGRASADPIDDPEGARPLTYAWEITGDDLRIVRGRTTDPELTITLFGAHPATVRLTVEDEDGRTATARLQLQLTVGHE